MGTRSNTRARKAAWLSFGLVALAVFHTSAQDASLSTGETRVAEATSVSSTFDAAVSNTPSAAPEPEQRSEEDDFDQASEASRAYTHALNTLNALAASPSPTPVPNNPFTSTFQGQGPAGSAARILARLLQAPKWNRKRAREDDGRGKAVKVLDLLQHAAELGHDDALYKLGEVSLFPPTPHFPSRPKLAYSVFAEHADRTGAFASHYYLSFFLTTGYAGVTPDAAKAHIHLAFAAHGGDGGAMRAMAYKYWAGIGVAEECKTAVEWYEGAAELAMAKFRAGPPGGRTLPQTSTRLADLVGGVYGPGASAASTGLNAQRPGVKAGFARAVGETWEDVLEYYKFNADRNELDFAYRLGKIYYQGSIYAAPGGIASGAEGAGRVPQDLAKARHYFEKITRYVWPNPPQPSTGLTAAPPSGNAKDDASAGGGNTAFFAAASAAYLGRMYLRGEGVRVDPALARAWFERGAEYGDRESHNMLGVIWRDGLVGGRKDVKKALAHFSEAAGQDLAEAQVNLGKYHFERGEMKSASAHFETAVRKGSPFEAYYYLAQLHASQAASPLGANAGSCAVAASFYKLVAERGTWGNDLVGDAEREWSEGTERGREMALLKWSMAAEQGSEVAQNNLAYVLDQDKTLLRHTRYTAPPSNATARRALTQWTRAARQRDVDALVKAGDYHFHGLGVQRDVEAAARYYQAAADSQLSALAMWDLGWMYENGVGVPQDFHLAKRYYDLALETNTEAYLPVVLSLIKLHARSLWHTLMGGKGGLRLWPGDEEEETFSSQRGSSAKLDGGKADDTTKDTGGEGDTKGPSDADADEDGAWYMGKAKEDFHKRKDKKDWRTVARDSEQDPIQWARDRKAEADRDGGDFGPEDYFDAALRGGNREEEIAEEFNETMLLVALVLLVSILLYVRTRVMERLRRARQELEAREAQLPGDPQPVQGNLGVFPPPEDPARDEWAILR